VAALGRNAAIAASEVRSGSGANLQLGGIYACPLLGYHRALLSVRLEGAQRSFADLSVGAPYGPDRTASKSPAGLVAVALMFTLWATKIA
jgi:hypothetical protein